MSINIYAAKCPSCGADINKVNGNDVFFCSYCGSKLMASNENEYIYRNIDEARLKEAETDRMIRLRELEIEQAEKERRRKGFAIAYGIALGAVLIGIIMIICNQLGGIGLIIVGFYVAFFTFVIQEKRSRKEKRW